MDYQREQLIQKAFEEGPDLLRDRKIAEFFDTVYMPSIWDNRLQPLMQRLALGTSAINMLRYDQVELLLNHCMSSKQPLPQFLYAYWLIYNRERWTETPHISRFMRWAADCGIGDAAWTMRNLLRSGEAGVQDMEKADFFEHMAEEKHSLKAYVWNMNNRIYGHNGVEADPAGVFDEVKERIQEVEDPVFLFLMSEALMECGEKETAEECARMAIDNGLVEQGFYCLRQLCFIDDEGNSLEEPDHDHLMAVLEEGTAKEDPASMYLLALHLDDDERTPQLLQRAGELGDGDACEQLALAIFNGKYNLDSSELDKAWYWFHRGAMCGNVNSFYYLYYMAAYAEDPNTDKQYVQFYFTDELKDRMPADDWKRLAMTVFEANGEEWLGDYEPDPAE